MTRESAVRLLFVQWVFIATLGTLFVTAQSISGKYGQDSELAWNWVLGQFTPAVSILISAAFSNPNKRWRSAPASQWKLKSAFALGTLQAVLLFAFLIIEPLVSLTPFELFVYSQWLLLLLQGIAVAAIGAVIFDGR